MTHINNYYNCGIETYIKFEVGGILLRYIFFKCILSKNNIPIFLEFFEFIVAANSN